MRSTCLKLSAVLLALAPLATLGLAGTAFLAPMPKQAHGPWYRVATLFDLPTDGQPIQATITVPTYDAWTRHPDSYIAHMFLRRRPEDGAVLALRPEHHDLHIPVKYDKEHRLFRSACWRLSFDLDGKEIESADLPRVGHEMAHLPVYISGAEIWVRNDE